MRMFYDGGGVKGRVFDVYSCSGDFHTYKIRFYIYYANAKNEYYIL